MRDKSTMEIAVVGGGIGGLAVAAGLLHRGLKVQVYEAAPAFAEIGAGVAFGPNSVAAMRAIAPGVFEGYMRQATENGDPAERATWFDFQTGTGKVERIHKVVVKNDEIGLSSVHRAHFLDELAALIPSEIAHFGKRLTLLEQDQSGVTLHFADQMTARATAVIGCDGIKSTVRPLVLGTDDPASTPRYSNKYAYRGLVPMKKAVAALGDYYARNGQMYLGLHGHVLTFPIDHGKIMNVVAFRTGTGTWDKGKWVLPTPEEDRVKDFEGWNVNVQSIIKMMEKSDVWALFEHPPAKSYFKDRVVLLGDAAHASTPHQGAGAGQALEDAFILASLFADPAVNDGDDIFEIFAAYDAVRRPRSQKVVTTSRECGNMYDFEGVDSGPDVKKIKATMEKMFHWIWEEDLESQLEQARRILLQGMKGKEGL